MSLRSDPSLDKGATAVAPDGQRRWRSMIFATLGDGQRRRRGTDGMRLGVAAVALLCCILAIRNGSHVDRTIVHVLYPVPHSLSWLVTFVYNAGSFGVTALLVAAALLTRRWVIARDLALSAVGTVAVSGLLIVALGSDGGRRHGIVIEGVYLHFPVIQVAVFMAVATAVLPYLARGLQRAIEVFVVGLAIVTVAAGNGLPLNVVGSLAIGWGVTAIVRLWFGSPLGLPSADDATSLLHEVGVPATRVEPLPYQAWGVANYRATEPVGGALHVGLRVSVYGRDAADARLLTKAGRFLFYRDSGPTLSFTRLQQVEHEAYLTLLASRGGARVPEVIAAAKAGAAGDAVLVSRMPPGIPLAGSEAGELTDEVLDDMYHQVLKLRSVGIAHGGISGETVLIDPPTGSAALVDFRNATSNSPIERLDRDLAGAVAAMALVVGAERAAAAAGRCLAPEIVTGVLQHLRRAGLDPALARALRGQKGLLEDVRQQIAATHAIEVPKLAEPRRVSWATLVVVLGTLIGGWALIGVLLDVSQSIDTIVGANWLWVVAAFVCSQLAFAGSAVEDLGSVSGILPYGRVLALEVANSFSALAGGTRATFATRVRFFQQEGYDASVAVSSSAVVSTASWIVKGALFLISLPLAWSSIHLETTPESGGNAKTVWILLAAVVGVALVAGLVLLVPRLRRAASDKLRPKLTDIWLNVTTVAKSPRKLIQLFGGAAASQVLVALALGASLRAFDDHLSLATLIVVITLASMIGGVSPVPGGMGVVEAGLILGLTAAGISESDATAAVFIQRLFTSYLPPIWGWGTLV
ncbi:MAG TPA: lysylphosphatidylglycerol synthase domain-containing protein, partial [Acidimicrobiales bacterium]|nr:lysylphosphatidylglycerol synthase domain-containing protein [Acidimicrobiales bacterium]